VLKEILPAFSTFFFRFGKTLIQGANKIYSVTASFVKIRSLKATLYLGAYIFLLSTFIFQAEWNSMYEIWKKIHFCVSWKSANDRP